VTAPAESFAETPRGRFRMLSWGEGPETVLYLHGLTGVAEVWGPAVAALPTGRRHVAIDQRGHGQTVTTTGTFSASDYLRDAVSVVELLGAPVHLVGHSMGARVAILFAARHSVLLRSVAVVDIGPEAWKENHVSTIRGLSTRPERFASQEEAFAFAFRSRTPTDSDRAIFLARLSEAADGSLTWRSTREALGQTVVRHRSRNYWKEWRAIEIPALYVHGGTSNEVRPKIAERMASENPGVQWREFEGVGHNIPLIAPERLAQSLNGFWKTLETKPS